MSTALTTTMTVTLPQSPLTKEDMEERGGAMSSTTSVSSSSDDNSALTCNDERRCLYHPPPSGVTYEENHTVFGKILRGESPAATWIETEHVLAFEDIHPRAPTHGLVIPKRLIKSVYDLTSAAAANDLELLSEMHATALQILREREPVAFAAGDYLLCFHVPPYNSVDHLHLHVLAPRSKMGFFPRFIKYNTNTNLAASLSSVQSRLKGGKTAVPYKRPKNY